VTVVTEYMTSHGHEQVVFITDPPSGLRAIIAIHSTALGPSLGGIRFWSYPKEEDAVLDVLRLSEAMTLKASMAGLYQGGGKAVVLLDAADAPHPEPLLRAMGQAIHELGGRYLAAEDVGASQHDMDVIALETPWVTGVATSAGGSGDPSPVTAIGVLAAMRAVFDALDGEPSISGRKVAIQGAGHVGHHLAKDLVEAGAEVVLADVNEGRARDAAADAGATVVPASEVLGVECDVLAPCALGAVLNEVTIPRLRCRAICGAANNQRADEHTDDLLEASGILYAPDYVANAGGIINIAEEFTGYSAERALERARDIEKTMHAVLERARDEKRPPGKVADDMARERVAREGKGRWKPGDPTAWTDGKPLVTLRPTAR